MIIKVIKKCPNTSHVLPDEEKSVLADTLAKVSTEMGKRPVVEERIFVYETAEDLIY